MSTLTINDLDEGLVVGLQARAAVNGKSMEEEALDILRAALWTEASPPIDPGHAIHARFAALGGIDLPPTPREAIRE